MTRVLGVVGVAGVVASITAGVYVYIASESVIGRTYKVPLLELVIPNDPTRSKKGSVWRG